MTNIKFEETTRASAGELINVYAEKMPAAVRKADETKTLLFPALAQMMCEIEDTNEEWSSHDDDDKVVGDGKVHFVAK